jgi:hypothetical protein
MSKDKDKKNKDKSKENENDEVTKEDLQYEDDGRLLLDAAKRGNVALMEELIKGSISRSLVEIQLLLLTHTHSFFAMM